jgi:hypothetical protein
LSRKRCAELDFVVFVPAVFALQKMLGNRLPLVFWQFVIEVSGKFFCYVFLHFTT